MQLLVQYRCCDAPAAVVLTLRFGCCFGCSCLLGCNSPALRIDGEIFMSAGMFRLAATGVVLARGDLIWQGKTEQRCVGRLLRQVLHVSIYLFDVCLRKLADPAQPCI